MLQEKIAKGGNSAQKKESGKLNGTGTKWTTGQTAEMRLTALCFCLPGLFEVS